MDVRNVYYLYGFINIDGTFVNNPDYKTFVAECKIGNNAGYSFYSFITIKTTDDKTRFSTNIIKLENLSDLIEDPTIIVKRVTQESVERYKKYFEAIYLRQENFQLEEMEGKKTNGQGNSKNC